VIASTMISVPGNHQHHAALQGRGATQVSNYSGKARAFSHAVLFVIFGGIGEVIRQLL